MRERALAEGEARARRQDRREVLVGVGLLLGLAAVLGVLAMGPIERAWARWSLARSLDWVTIPAPPGGEFLMGCVPGDFACNQLWSSDEKPRHPVRLSRPFELMKRHVTVAQFRRFTEALRIPLTRQPPEIAEDDPVVYVSWDESRKFCEYVGGRLPTEAEWEYAARGGHPDWTYPWGDEPRARGAARQDNGFGLGDMVEAAFQWTSTLHRAYPYAAEDGREEPASDEARVFRGGAFDGASRYLRVSFRSFGSPDLRSYALGVRCARTISP